MGTGDSPPYPYHMNRRGTAYLRGDTVLAIRRRAPTGLWNCQCLKLLCSN